MNTEKTEKTKASEKEPLSIWEEASAQRRKALQQADLHKNHVADKLKQGYTWVQVDNRTRKLIKIEKDARK